MPRLPFYLFLGVLPLVASCGVKEATPAGGAATVIRSATGIITLKYSLMEGTSLTTTTLEGVRSVEVHPTFVLFRTGSGGGVFMLDKTVQFSWSGQD